jgi:hypothetical protein
MLFAYQAVVAEDVILELQNTSFSKGTEFQAWDNNIIRQVAFSNAPKGVKAPAGNIKWFNIMLGTKTYFSAMYMENNSAVRYIIDRNGNGDLNNENSENIVMINNNQFIEILGLTGVFQIDCNEITAPLNILLMTNTINVVLIYSSYKGKIKVGGQELVVNWLPGFDPIIGDPSNFSAHLVYRNYLRIEPTDVHIKDGKPVATCKVAEDKMIYLVKCPKSLDFAFAVIDNKSLSKNCILAYPDNGFITIPRVKYQIITFYASRTMDSDNYCVMFSIGPNAVKDGLDLGEIEPLAFILKVEPCADGTAKFTGAVLTAGNKIIYLDKKEGTQTLPTVSVKTADGKEVYKFTFQPG